MDPVRDLLDFLDKSPSPWHAAAESRRRLVDGGFRELDPADAWRGEPGDRQLAVFGDGTLVAWIRGMESPAEGGFRIVGAHTDSPGLRVRPNPDVSSEGLRQLSVEPYGGVLLPPWLDRDLGVAGRIVVRRGGGLESVLVRSPGAVACIPNLAIHLQREIRTDGFRPDPQKHLVPIVSLAGEGGFREDLVRWSGLADLGPDDVVSWDLALHDVQRAALVGSREELITSGRLDNLASCHAGLAAILDGADRPARATRVLALHDHEEIGSRTAEGAAGPALEGVLRRLASEPGEEPWRRAASRSLLASVDMAHAVHPNYADRHDRQHAPALGGGPVLKTHASRSYASDALSSAAFLDACRRAGVTPQVFASRADIACGSTIGPISAARLGISTVDVGSPMLAMHSCRETAAASDVVPMIRVLAELLAG